MTRDELQELLGDACGGRIYEGIRVAKELYPKFKSRIKHDDVEPNYTKEEIRLICICMGMNTIQQEIVEDKWDEYSKEKKLLWVRTKSQYIDGTEEFIKKVERNKGIKACANCMFCIGKTIKLQSIKMYPYCTFYKKYIVKMKVIKYGKEVKPDIFVDRCDSWRKSEPHLFLKD